MDIFLTNNANNFIQLVIDANNYGYSYYDISREPAWALMPGIWSTAAVNRFLSEYKKDIDNIITFAEKWDINPDEWKLTDEWDRFKFAAGYIACQLQSDQEWKNEQKTA